MFTIDNSSVAINFVNLTQKEQNQLVTTFRGKDSKRADIAKEILISRFEPLIKSIASAYKSSNFSEQTLIKYGHKGLMNALETYDLSKKYRLAAYATWFIRAEIHKLIGLPVDPENSNY